MSEPTDAQSQALPHSESSTGTDTFPGVSGIVAHRLRRKSAPVESPVTPDEIALAQRMAAIDTFPGVSGIVAHRLRRKNAPVESPATPDEIALARRMADMDEPGVSAFSSWPQRADLASVTAHRDELARRADELARAVMTDDDRIWMRAYCRGAAVWDLWLLEQGDLPMAAAEERAISALTMSERAGDWPLIETILDKWIAARRPAHKRFYINWKERSEQSRKTVRPLVLQMGTEFQKWKQNRSQTDVEATVVTARNVICNIGMVAEATYLLFRVLSDSDRMVDAKHYVNVLCIADPLRAVCLRACKLRRAYESGTCTAVVAHSRTFPRK